MVNKICFKESGQAARIGGDEFIIIADISNEAELKNKIEKIHLELNKLNQENIKGYSVKVSLGYKRLDFYV